MAALPLVSLLQYPMINVIQHSIDMINAWTTLSCFVYWSIFFCFIQTSNGYHTHWQIANDDQYIWDVVTWMNDFINNVTWNVCKHAIRQADIAQLCRPTECKSPCFTDQNLGQMQIDQTLELKWRLYFTDGGVYSMAQNVRKTITFLNWSFGHEMLGHRRWLIVSWGEKER